MENLLSLFIFSIAMPELPEVEVTRRSFAERIAGARIDAVRLGKPLRWPLGAEPQTLLNRSVLGVRRRGKYLLMDLSEGLLLLHLGMSGSLRFASDLPAFGQHDHFEMHTTKGLLRLNDPRRFGAVLLVESENDARAQKLLAKLGLEPLDEAFDADVLYRELQQRRAEIKQVLLGGQIVVGLGNIYASEALFHARIHPQTSAAKLSKIQVKRLWQAIRNVMQSAIEQGGSSLRNYSDAEGCNGYFQLEAMVYGRSGKPCPVCTQPVRLLRQGQRSTYFCSRCQKRQ